MNMLHCCGCDKKVTPRLTDGKEIYPHRNDLYRLPFWVCDACGNYVGCHHKTGNPTKPLGCIPTPQLRKARAAVHMYVDPIWRRKLRSRKQLYADISREIGYPFHSADTKTVADCYHIMDVVVHLRDKYKRLTTE